MLQYIPAPNVSTNQFSSGAEKLRLNDGKGSGRVDANTDRWGNFYIYYFLDKYDLDNPYPSGFGGASVPGYDALSSGMDQMEIGRNARRDRRAASGLASHFSELRSFSTASMTVP